MDEASGFVLFGVGHATRAPTIKRGTAQRNMGLEPALPVSSSGDRAAADGVAPRCGRATVDDYATLGWELIYTLARWGPFQLRRARVW